MSVVTLARECVGTPFRHQGRVPGRGLDCAGLIIHVASALGVEYLDEQGYSRHPHLGRLQAALDAQPCFEVVDSMESGDVLLMKFRKEPTHLAIYTGETIIHAYEQIGAVCEHRMDAEWLSRVVRIYRFRGDL